MFHDFQKKWHRSGQELLDEIREAVVPSDQVYIWYIGQCGFVLKGAVTVLIDPVLNDLTDESGNTVKYYPAPFAPDQIRADYCLCTHAHADHMAIPTVCGLAAADPGLRFIVPADCIPPMTVAGIPREQILEAGAGREILLTGLSVHPVSAAHPTHAHTADGGDVALSYSFTMNGLNILHMGDTYLTDALYADLLALPAPDLFCPPINGGDYFRTARDCIGNLSARESARLAVELGARLTLPTHYDMVMDNTVDPFDFVRELWTLDTSARWKLPALGEKLILYKDRI